MPPLVDDVDIATIRYTLDSRLPMILQVHSTTRGFDVQGGYQSDSSSGDIQNRVWISHLEGGSLPGDLVTLKRQDSCLPIKRLRHAPESAHTRFFPPRRNSTCRLLQLCIAVKILDAGVYVSQVLCGPRSHCLPQVAGTWLSPNVTHRISNPSMQRI
jgi:hypothetical protein